MSVRAFPIVLCAIASSCSSQMPQDAQVARQPIRAGVALSQGKCEEAARGHDRPFVVEWDATDLSTFEARASRGVLMVRYEGCKLDVLYECSDPPTPGQFGTYGPPQMTSGGVQTIDVKNEGELYTKLPLGALKLGGRVQLGETLHLKYHVSGVATATRDAIYRGEITRNPACAMATHFVWAYNLGAFELSSESKKSANVDVNVGKVGAGAKGRRDESAISQGGSLASCSSQDQRGCRVPIRLALRSIRSGQHPAGLMSQPALTQPIPGPDSSPAMQAQRAFLDGAAKIQAGDGPGCLRSLDRALALDPRQNDSYGFKLTRVRCQMRAGKCDEGGKNLRGLIASQDTARIKTDEQLDREVRDTQNRECPSSTAKNDGDFVMRAARELIDATLAKDSARCKDGFERLAKRVAKISPRGPDAAARAQSFIALDQGALCAARTLGCDVGLALWKRKYRLQLPDVANVDRIATESFYVLARMQQLCGGNRPVTLAPPPLRALPPPVPQRPLVGDSYGPPSPFSPWSTLPPPP